VVFDDAASEIIAVKDSFEFEQYRFSQTIRCSTVQFSITEVYRGTQYDDTCIAEAILLSRPISDREAKRIVDLRIDGESLERPDTMAEYLDLYDYIPFGDPSRAALPDTASTLNLTGDLPRIDGATALYPVYASFVRAVYPPPLRNYSYHPYSLDNDGIITVGCGRTERAYENLIDGRADLIFCYEPSREHIKTAEKKGLRFNLTPIGRDAFVFFVNRNNPLAGLTQGQIRDIYSGRVRNWQSITGKDEPVIAYQRPENSGSQTILQSIMGGKPVMEPMREMIAMEMGLAVDYVAEYYNYQGALGYSFLFYVNNMAYNNRGIKMLSLEGVFPTGESIQNRRYPFVKDFYAVTIAGRETENTRRLIAWILSEQGQSLVEKTGYVRN
jgi:phosphate transport system substrate-binding protein